MRRPADNPFRASMIESLAYRCTTGDTDTMMQRLNEMGHRAAIVGPHGSGKTTLLEDLADRYRAARYDVIERRLTSDCRRLAPELFQKRDRRILLLDSAGWLHLTDRWRLRRSSIAMIITSHRSTFVPTLIETVPRSALLRALLEQLVGDDAEVWWPTARQSFERCGGNVREVWRELYDEWLTRLPAERRV